MNLTTADNLGRALVSKHLTGWSFSWNKRKTAFGVCNYRKKTIFLSTCLTETETEDATTQTILHEIAHALAGPGTGHGKYWRMVAREIGVRAPRSTRAPSAPTEIKPRWVMVFQNEIVKGYHRKPGQSTFNSLHTIYVRGRKRETIGKLVIMTYSEYATAS